MFLTRIITTALVVVAAAVAAPTASAMPDRAPVSVAGQDLRGPDARPAVPVVQDLRSPNAGDAVVPPADSAVGVSGDDFPWLDAGLAAALALALIGLGVATVRRRSPAASA